MTPEEFVRAALLAAGVNGGEAIFVGSGPAGEWSSAYDAQVLVQEYTGDADTTLDGRRFWRRRVQVEVASPSARNAMVVAEQVVAALDYRGPHNPAPGLADQPYAVSLLSGPARAGVANGVHYVVVNVEVLYGEGA